MRRDQYRGLVVMLFYSQRCSACRRVLRQWRSFVQSHRGEAVFLALPYNRHTRRLFEYFDVTELPTLIILRDGRIVARVDGVSGIEEVEEIYTQATIGST